MTSKERVLRAINHEETDRIPLDLGGMACSLFDQAYLRLRDALGITGDIAPFRRGSNTSYYDERVLDALDIDVRRVFAKVSDRYPIVHEDGTFSSEWGILQRRGQFGVEFVRHPLQDLEDPDIPVAEGKGLPGAGRHARARQAPARRGQIRHFPPRADERHF